MSEIDNSVSIEVKVTDNASSTLQSVGEKAATANTNLSALEKTLKAINDIELKFKSFDTNPLAGVEEKINKNKKELEKPIKITVDIDNVEKISKSMDATVKKVSESVSKINSLIADISHKEIIIGLLIDNKNIGQQVANISREINTQLQNSVKASVVVTAEYNKMATDRPNVAATRASDGVNYKEWERDLKGYLDAKKQIDNHYNELGAIHLKYMADEKARKDKELSDQRSYNSAYEQAIQTDMERELAAWRARRQTLKEIDAAILADKIAHTHAMTAAMSQSSTYVPPRLSSMTSQMGSVNVQNQTRFSDSARIEAEIRRQEADNLAYRQQQLISQSRQTGSGNQTSVINELSNSLNKLQQTLMMVGVAMSGRQIMEYADHWTHFTNAVGIATEKTGNAAGMQERLFKLAVDARAPLDSITTLYLRMSRASESLNATQSDTVKAIDTVTKALAIMGTSPNAVRGGLLQLEQALGGVTVRGQEFKSILDSMPNVMGIVVKHYDEAAKTIKLEEAALRGATAAEIEAIKNSPTHIKTIADLRNAMYDGKITSEAFFKAILLGNDEINKTFEKTHKTFAQGFTEVETYFTKFVGRMNEGSHASDLFFKSMLAIGEHMDLLVSGVTALGAALITVALNSEKAAAGMALMSRSPIGLAVGAVAGLGMYGYSKSQEEQASKTEQQKLIERMREIDSSINAHEKQSRLGTAVSDVIGVYDKSKLLAERALLDEQLKKQKEIDSINEEEKIAEAKRTQGLNKLQVEQLDIKTAFGKALSQEIEKTKELTQANDKLFRIKKETNDLLDKTYNFLPKQLKEKAGTVGTTEYYDFLSVKAPEMVADARNKAAAKVEADLAKEAADKSAREAKSTLESLTPKIQVDDEWLKQELEKVNKQVELHSVKNPIKIKAVVDTEDTVKRLDKYNPLFQKYASGQVSPELLRAVAAQESRGIANATSRAGAMGLMQFMPATAKGFGIDAYDPEQAVKAANKYLNQLLKMFDGDLTKALAGYNAGENRVKSVIEKSKVDGKDWMSHLRPETKDYVPLVMGRMGGSESQVKASQEFVTLQSRLAEFDEVKKQRNEAILKSDAKRAEELDKQLTLIRKQIGWQDQAYIKANEIADTERSRRAGELQDLLKLEKAGYAYSHAFDELRERQDVSLKAKDLAKELGGFAVPAIDSSIKEQLKLRDELSATKKELTDMADEYEKLFKQTGNSAYAAMRVDTETMLLDTDSELLIKNKEITDLYRIQLSLKEQQRNVIPDLIKGNDDLLTSLTTSTLELEKQSKIKQAGATGTQAQEIRDLIDTRENLKLLTSVKDTVTGSITSGFTTMFTDVLTKGKSFTDAFRDMFKNLVSNISSSLMNIGMNAMMSGNWLAGGAAMIGGMAISLMQTLFKTKPVDTSTPESAFTSSVYGASSESSRSVDNITNTLQSIHVKEYGALRDIADGFKNITKAVDNTISLAVNRQGGWIGSTTGMTASSKNPAGSAGMIGAGLVSSTAMGAAGMGLAGGALAASAATAVGMGTATSVGVGVGSTGMMVGGAIIGLAGGLILAGLQFGLGKLLGIGKTKFEAIGSGITMQANQFIIGGAADALKVYDYSKIKATTKGWFSDTVKIYDTINGVNNEMTNSFKGVFGYFSTELSKSLNILGLQVVSDTKAIIPKIKLDLKGLKSDAITKKVSDSLNTTFDLIADDVTNGFLDRFKRMGEGAFETLTRVAIDINQVNEKFKDLGVESKNLGTLGFAIMSEQLIQMYDSTGKANDGLKNFTSAIDKFFNVVTSKGEKFDIANKGLSEIFTNINNQITLLNSLTTKAPTDFKITESSVTGSDLEKTNATYAKAYANKYTGGDVSKIVDLKLSDLDAKNKKDVTKDTAFFNTFSKVLKDNETRIVSNIENYSKMFSVSPGYNITTVNTDLNNLDLKKSIDATFKSVNENSTTLQNLLTGTSSLKALLPQDMAGFDSERVQKWADRFAKGSVDALMNLKTSDIKKSDLDEIKGKLDNQTGANGLFVTSMLSMFDKNETRLQQLTTAKENPEAFIASTFKIDKSNPIFNDLLKQVSTILSIKDTSTQLEVMDYWMNNLTSQSEGINKVVSGLIDSTETLQTVLERQQSVLKITDVILSTTKSKDYMTAKASKDSLTELSIGTDISSLVSQIDSDLLPSIVSWNATLSETDKKFYGITETVNVTERSLKAYSDALIDTKNKADYAAKQKLSIDSLITSENQLTSEYNKRMMQNAEELRIAREMNNESSTKINDILILQRAKEQSLVTGKYNELKDNLLVAGMSDTQKGDYQLGKDIKAINDMFGEGSDAANTYIDMLRQTKAITDARNASGLTEVKVATAQDIANKRKELSNALAVAGLDEYNRSLVEFNIQIAEINSVFGEASSAAKEFIETMKLTRDINKAKSFLDDAEQAGYDAKYALADEAGKKVLALEKYKNDMIKKYGNETISGVEGTLKKSDAMVKMYVDNLNKVDLSKSIQQLRDFRRAIADWAIGLQITQLGSTKSQLDTAQGKLAYQLSAYKSSTGVGSIDMSGITDKNTIANLNKYMAQTDIANTGKTVADIKSAIEGSITGTADQTITAIRNFYGSSKEGNELIQQVIDAVSVLPQQVDPQLRMVDLLEDIKTGIFALPDALKGTVIGDAIEKSYAAYNTLKSSSEISDSLKLPALDVFEKAISSTVLVAISTFNDSIKAKAAENLVLTTTATLSVVATPEMSDEDKISFMTNLSEALDKYNAVVKTKIEVPTAELTDTMTDVLGTISVGMTDMISALNISQLLLDTETSALDSATGILATFVEDVKLTLNPESEFALAFNELMAGIGVGGGTALKDELARIIETFSDIEIPVMVFPAANTSALIQSINDIVAAANAALAALQAIGAQITAQNAANAGASVGVQIPTAVVPELPVVPSPVIPSIPPSNIATSTPTLTPRYFNYGTSVLEGEAINVGYYGDYTDVEGMLRKLGLSSWQDFEKYMDAKNGYFSTNGYFASGGAFTNGIVSKPTVFNMGLMGESGSEAIMPLANINGSLGVRAIAANDSGNNEEELAELKTQNKLLQAQIEVMQAAFRTLIKQNEVTNDKLDSIDSTTRKQVNG